MAIKSVLLSLVVISGLAGCGQTPESTSRPAVAEASDTWLPSLVAFKKGDDPGCRHGLEVQLSAKGPTLTGVLLHNIVQGACDLFVPPNKRFYELTLVRTDCGSNIYTGKLRIDDKTSRVEVVDNRQRTCEDYRPYAFEVKESEGSADDAQWFVGNW